jgi:cytochrome c oxidase cbb3-type subunit 2
MKTAGKGTALGTVLAVAGIYAYFLLFAQFALLERIRAVLGEGATLKAVLGLMAVGGIGSGFAAARWLAPRRGLSTALVVCAVAAAVAAMPLPGWAFPIVSFATGAAMGVATVCLAGRIAGIADRRRGCVWLGWGTGLAYGFCNLPPVFMAGPAAQCGISAAVAVAALAGGRFMDAGEAPPGGWRMPWRAMGVFGALVWMDAAAFFVIQHASELKQGTWREELLWRNAAVHLAVAVAAGHWLARGGLRPLWVAAWALLALAGWWVNSPENRELAGWLYPAGVSLYSTALIAWPALLAEPRAGNGRHPAMARAAWLFGVAGWLASGLGIGMVESLQRVPGAFLMIAGVVVVAGACFRRIDRRSAAALAVVASAGLWQGGGDRPANAIERGHQVYLAEGCIHCHSRYVRPEAAEEDRWGGADPPESIRAEHPVLIGNRRQGPDLLHVGGRRSAAWLREHFRDPRAFSPDSSMPSYAHLLDDGRADDLIAWLRQDAASQAAHVWKSSLAWQPSEVPSGDAARGRERFARSCALCHGDEGRGDGRLATVMQTPPRNLVAGPFGMSAERPGESPQVSVMRVLRFGLPGTDMPGHETWSDQELADVAAWVLGLRQSAAPAGR